MLSSTRQGLVGPGEETVGQRTGVGHGLLDGLRRRRGILVPARPWRQILIHRFIAKLRQQIEAFPLLDELRHGAVGVAEIAEVPRAGRTGAYAGGGAVLPRAGVVVGALEAHPAVLLPAV